MLPNVNLSLKCFAVKGFMRFHNKILKGVMDGLIFSYGGWMAFLAEPKEKVDSLIHYLDICLNI